MKYNYRKVIAVILTYMLTFGTVFQGINTAYAANTAYADDIWPAGPDIFGESAILMEAGTGAVIYMKNAKSKRYPASITKIVTAVLAIEYGKTDDTVIFSDNAINSLPLDAAKVGIVPGEEIPLIDCLHALILRSGNEVANALAEYVENIAENSGDVPEEKSRASFADLMNDFAKRAGAVDTHFANPSGLHDNNHYTTAYDMALIAKEAVKNQVFCSVWGTGAYTMPQTNKNSGPFDIWHRHSMLVKTRAEYYEYAVGGKTGYTGEAGNTLVTYAQKDGMSLICVVLRSDTKYVYKDTKALLEYGFNNFKILNVAENDGRFSADGSRLTNILKPDAYDSIVIPVNANIGDFETKIVYEPAVTPEQMTTAGVTAGEIQYMHGDYYLGKADLIFSAGAELYSYGTPSEKSAAEEDIENDIIIINIKYIIAILVAIAAISFLIIFFRMTGTKKTGRGRGRYRGRY